MQRSAFCRSRQELSNAYLLAQFGFDTASRTSPVKLLWTGGGSKNAPACSLNRRSKKLEVCRAAAQGIIANLRSIKHANWSMEEHMPSAGLIAYPVIAAATSGRAQLLAKKGASIRRMQRPPELVPIPGCCLNAA